MGTRRDECDGRKEGRWNVSDDETFCGKERRERKGDERFLSSCLTHVSSTEYEKTYSCTAPVASSVRDLDRWSEGGRTCFVSGSHIRKLREYLYYPNNPSALTLCQ